MKLLYLSSTGSVSVAHRVRISHGLRIQKCIYFALDSFRL